MIRVYAKHLPYDDGHLAPIADEMLHAGPPTIFCVRWRNMIFAVTGSHRLASCHHLGLVPKLIMLPEDGGTDLDGFWAHVAAGLPYYDFEHVEMLEVESYTARAR